MKPRKEKRRRRKIFKFLFYFNKVIELKLFSAFSRLFPPKWKYFSNLKMKHFAAKLNESLFQAVPYRSQLWNTLETHFSLLKHFSLWYLGFIPFYWTEDQGRMSSGRVWDWKTWSWMQHEWIRETEVFRTFKLSKKLFSWKNLKTSLIIYGNFLHAPRQATWIK